MRKLIFLGLVQALLVLGGCGGGGGASLTTSGGGSSGGGGGGGGNSSPANVVTMTVDAGPTSSYADADTPFITVTVCSPGSTTNCVQIPDVEVDTGSYGLRIMSSVLSSSFISSLTQVNASNGSPLVECTQFADGISWGPIVLADVQVGGESASSIPIQVMGDSSFENEIPSGCSSNGRKEDDVESFGANGIIGVGPFKEDCGSGCTLSNSYYASDPWYYGCPSGGTSTNDCAPVGVDVSQQVANPVAYFTSTGDDNGVIVELPSVPDPNGAVSATGSLIFGIGTQGNNVLGSVTVLTGNTYGDVTVSYTGTNGSNSLPDSYLDTGSNAYYFDAANTTSIPPCQSSGSSSSSSTFTSSWLCPTTEQTIALTLEGQNDTPSTVDIKIYNADTLLNENNMTYTAFDNLGADTGSQSSYCQSNLLTTGAGDCYFDLGLPFFFGRHVYVGISGTNTAGAGEGPFFAYSSD